MKVRAYIMLAFFFLICVPGNSLCSSPATIISRDEKKRSLISFENTSDAV